MTDEDFRMTSHRPYLLRALVEWINDNGLTPHILVDASVPGVQVPASAIKDGRVVLNIADRAVRDLLIDNTSIGFAARFSGVSSKVHVPIAAVLAVYARETGQGMALPDDILGTEPEVDEGTEGDDGVADNASHALDDTPPDDTPPKPTGRPHLRVVK